MPYADKQRQREYNRVWAKRHQNAAAHSPLADLIADVLKEGQPLGPTEISRRVETTPNTVNVALHRMKHAGRVARQGYGRWVIAE